MASTSQPEKLEPDHQSGRLRVLAFVAFCAACLVGTVAYVLWARARAAEKRGTAGMQTVGTGRLPSSTPDADLLTAIRSGAHLYVRSTREGEFGRIAIASLAAPNERRVLLERTCERVHFGGTLGICLTATYEGALPTTFAGLLGTEDTSARRVHAGFPSRARIASDDRMAATTVFVTGDDYQSDFSTRTILLELPAAKPIAELEEFTVYRDGHPFRAIDFNYWGVTFAADSNRFYATLMSAGDTYLVRGDIKARTVQVLTMGVECPSLSPDQNHLAFKRRTGHGHEWRLWVMDVATLRQRPIAAETRSIDDQVEWLDDEHILYAAPDEAGHTRGVTNVWVSSVEENAIEPRMFVTYAASPAVVRR